MVTILFHGTFSGTARSLTAILASDDAKVSVAVFSELSIPVGAGKLHAPLPVPHSRTQPRLREESDSTSQSSKQK